MTQQADHTREQVPSPLPVSSDAVPPANETMTRRTIMLEDGRSMTFYDFEPEKPAGATAGN